MDVAMLPLVALWKGSMAMAQADYRTVVSKTTVVEEQLGVPGGPNNFAKKRTLGTTW